MKDITCKLREIKVHRTINQMKEDIIKYMYTTNITVSIEEFLAKKYPDIPVETDKKYDEEKHIWLFNITIRKPVHRIETIFTITPDGVKYN
jgi:hypothetical protein